MTPPAVPPTLVTDGNRLVPASPSDQQHSQRGHAMSKAEKIVAGLGGAANIVEVEACITRLRTEVKDASLVDESALKAAGAHGVLAAGRAVQVIVGPEADTLAEDIEDLL
ncbi:MULTISPECIES: PTS glucose/sucrose transporter subunit IIB [Sinomonas]|nr:PTS glucose/sucrose transporter subunit IIB [Sinomonas atrocyanea]